MQKEKKIHPGIEEHRVALFLWGGQAGAQPYGAEPPVLMPAGGTRDPALLQWNRDTERGQDWIPDGQLGQQA